MSDEIWRHIPSLPGYIASTYGRVMCVPYVDDVGRLRGGVPTQGWWEQDKRYNYGRFVHSTSFGTKKVAKMVCEAFHGPRPADKPVVSHIDGDSRNNRPENLMWDTQKNNMRMPEARQNMSEAQKRRHERERLAKHVEARVDA